MASATRRAIGFGLGAAGALASGLGALLPWSTVGLRADREGVLDQTLRGTDLAGGLVVLAAAGLVLAGLLAFRLVPPPVRVSIAVGLMLTGLAIATAAGLSAATGEERATEEVARGLAASGGMTAREAEDLIRTDPDLAIRWSIGPGAWLAFAGGIAVIAAGAVSVGLARPSD
jgi:hypothetical protein